VAIDEFTQQYDTEHILVVLLLPEVEQNVYSYSV